jgi:hypothetical protein
MLVIDGGNLVKRNNHLLIEVIHCKSEEVVAEVHHCPGEEGRTWRVKRRGMDRGWRLVVASYVDCHSP